MTTMQDLRIKPLELPDVYFVNKELKEPGDSVWGALVHYNPLFGALTFDRDPCGCLMLMRLDGRVAKIGLDKGQLATAVDNALALAKYVIAPPVAPFLIVKVTYEGDDKGYKRYRCEVGLSRGADAHRQAFGQFSEVLS